jgi:hypothetical protein
MACSRKLIALGLLAPLVAFPAPAFAECKETFSRHPMMSPVSAVGPRPGPSARAALLAAPVAAPRPPRVRRAPAASGPRRKAAHVRKAAHAGKAPVRRKLAARRAGGAAPAAAPKAVGTPDARLMMTRLGPPADAPRYMELTTTVCTTGPAAAPILPDDLLPDQFAETGRRPPGFPPDEIFEIPPLLPPTDEPIIDLVPVVSPPGPPLPPLTTPGVVPEPHTWALMILGFGVVGGALRRRRLRRN